MCKYIQPRCSGNPTTGAPGESSPLLLRPCVPTAFDSKHVEAKFEIYIDEQLLEIIPKLPTLDLDQHRPCARKRLALKDLT